MNLRFKLQEHLDVDHTREWNERNSGISSGCGPSVRRKIMRRTKKLCCDAYVDIMTNSIMFDRLLRDSLCKRFWFVQCEVSFWDTDNRSIVRSIWPIKTTLSFHHVWPLYPWGGVAPQSVSNFPFAAQPTRFLSDTIRCETMNSHLFRAVIGDYFPAAERRRVNRSPGPEYWARWMHPRAWFLSLQWCTILAMS